MLGKRVEKVDYVESSKVVYFVVCLLALNLKQQIYIVNFLSYMLFNQENLVFF